VSEAPEGDLPFSYDEYSEWFDQYSRHFLQPARIAAATALNELLDRELPEPQRVRIRVGPGRVKSKARTWKKLNDKYRGEVQSTGDIPAAVDDLVGMRVVCTNKSDVDRLVEVLDGLERYSRGDDPVLSIHPDSTKDWRAAPKSSGYRAYHLNLCTSVPQATTRHVVVCELQIRTLLQDSWGELTHEDTYKPGGEPPALVETLSKRMADLMATLDDIAEDLRSELDMLAEDSLEGSQSGATGVAVSHNREAAEAYLSERIEALNRPTPLATLAWELQREFGPEVSDSWLGHGTFKNFLHAMAPDARVSSDGPSYVLPAGFDISAYDNFPHGVPRVVSLLKDADRMFPLISSEHWLLLYEALADATSELHWMGAIDRKALNELTRTARDTSNAAGKDHMSRVQLAYIATALQIGLKLKPEMSASEIEDEFVGWMLQRASGMGLPQADCEELERWLRGQVSYDQSESAGRRHAK
jgi:ppGpp synthetase/RelA/SpoT-type nucleotidyltranferase